MIQLHHTTVLIIGAAGGFEQALTRQLLAKGSQLILTDHPKTSWGFSEGLRHELSPHNVRVTTVYPFFSRTPILNGPKFGRFADAEPTLPAALITAPEQIMATTIRAIERNQNEVFPDKFALVGHWLKRYFSLAFRGLGQLNP